MNVMALRSAYSALLAVGLLASASASVPALAQDDPSCVARDGFDGKWKMENGSWARCTKVPGAGGNGSSWVWIAGGLGAAAGAGLLLSDGSSSP